MIKSVVNPVVGIGGRISTVTYCDEFQAVYDSWTNKPSDAVALVLNTMVAFLVTTGVWTILDVFYYFAIHTNAAGEALTNWKLPGTFDATLHGTVNPGFIAFEGFTGNVAQSAYVNTNWNVNTNGVNYVKDSASAGIYVRTNANENTFDLGGHDGVNFLGIQSRTAAGSSMIRVNSTLAGSVANANSTGMYIANRVLSTEQDLWRNKTRIINHSRGSSGIPNEEVIFLGNNADGTKQQFSSRQLSMGFAGGGFTQAHINNMTNAVEASMDSNGKGVIT